MATWKKVLTEDSPVSASGLSSTGDVTVQLDSDNNTSDSKFEILKGDGSVLLSVNESGITAGSLTTSTPSVVLGSSTYAQGATATAIISNYDSAAEYTMGIYDSSGNLQGISPTLSNGVITFPAPAIVATGWELRVKAAKIGFFYQFGRRGYLPNHAHKNVYSLENKRLHKFWFSDCRSYIPI